MCAPCVSEWAQSAINKSQTPHAQIVFVRQKKKQTNSKRMKKYHMRTLIHNEHGLDFSENSFPMFLYVLFYSLLIQCGFAVIQSIFLAGIHACFFIFFGYLFLSVCVLVIILILAVIYTLNESKISCFFLRCFKNKNAETKRVERQKIQMYWNKVSECQFIATKT